jgi:preprotein translocase subunit YajC
METLPDQPNPLMSLLPLLIIMVPMIFVVRKLAIDKGKDAALYTVLACIPIVNFFIWYYIMGAPSKRLEDKLDKILEALKKPEQ